MQPEEVKTSNIMLWNNGDPKPLIPGSPEARKFSEKVHRNLIELWCDQNGYVATSIVLTPKEQNV